MSYRIQYNTITNKRTVNHSKQRKEGKAAPVSGGTYSTGKQP